MKQYKLEFGEEEKEFNENEFLPEFKIEINPGHYLELMDRLHVVLSTLNDHIFYHPLTMKEADVAILVEEAMNKLADAYQLVGNKEHTK
jgi:hypothetical protein